MKSTSKKKIEPDWRRIAELYEEAKALSPEVRVLWIEEFKNSEPEVYERLNTLILEEPKVENFLVGSAADGVKISVEKKQIPDFKVNETLNGYTIKGTLGIGGSAKVYVAKDEKLGRRVAIKVFLNQSEEARTLASLEHDNIVKVYAEEVLPDRNLRLIAMQLIQGPSLESVLQRLQDLGGKGLSGAAILKIVDRLALPYPSSGSVSSDLLQERTELANKDYVDAILWLGMKMCDALSYAHSQNVLHLDVKPGNIILSQYGRPFLTDFGVSLTSRVKNLAAQLGGTPKYMPPEQLALFNTDDIEQTARQLKPTVDVYSLGLVLKEFLLLPSRAEFKERASLDWIIAKATSPRAASRYSSAADFKLALKSEQEIRTLKRAVWETDHSNPMSRHPLIALTLIGAIPQLCASAIGTIYNAVRIVNALTPHQRALFQWLNLTLTPFIFVAITAIWLGVLLKLRRYALNPVMFSGRPDLVKKLRTHLLRVPQWGMLVTTLGWLPAAVLYPVVLYYGAGGLSGITILHFAVSFSLSWFIALSYSYLLHTFICIKLLYKDFWYGCTNVQNEAQTEVGRTLIPVRASLIAIVLVPLAAAILVMMTGKQGVSDSDWKLFQLLVVCLITMGALGTYFSLSIGQSLVKTLLNFKVGKKDS